MNMKFKKRSIRHIQTYVAFRNKRRGFDKETLCQRLVLLSEEVGELMKACRNEIRGNRRNNLRAISEEFVDVINVAVSVGNTLGIDLEEEFLRKMDIIDKRMAMTKKLKLQKT
ncbi:MAG: hypothetical protein A2934_01470 [Candidatus Sungbacteria bacterium RIFCSPLOWO2_01_FULL_47_10]|uniref:NTP pyrophosphohydrolase MazG putative catalytic core domain-containing protein n=1 Tax=Candidatus Sungbacteria bacterium RIFCSPLOWO2_01_FULL_47_10 TaxID=1802276 RepID=A0A1G2L5L8_9BACT|nr:MAG: hypothetical protein A2934_01470 [Candidatus Sungbacteria bacterium RIFCSPLOWO2_01_FULL_47_10]